MDEAPACARIPWLDRACSWLILIIPTCCVPTKHLQVRSTASKPLISVRRLTPPVRLLARAGSFAVHLRRATTGTPLP